MGSYRFKTILVYGSCILLALIIAGYSIYQAKNLILGPRISVTAPSTGQRVASSSIDIVGIAFNTASLSLDGRTIFTDEQGNFKEKLLIPPGYTIILLSATDKFGRTTTKKLELTH